MTKSKKRELTDDDVVKIAEAVISDARDKFDWIFGDDAPPRSTGVRKFAGPTDEEIKRLARLAAEAEIEAKRRRR